MGKNQEPEIIKELEKAYGIKLEKVINNNLILSLGAEKSNLYTSYNNEIIGLNLRENEITDLTPLKSLNHLKVLDLSDNQIVDLKPISHLTELIEMDLSNNQISDLAPLNRLTKLKTLFLDINRISDLNLPKSLSSLKSLNLGSNKIVNLETLSGLQKLEYLNLMYNQISSLKSLKPLEELKILQLENNKILDIQELKILLSFPKLKNLEVSHNPFISRTNLSFGYRNNDLLTIKNYFLKKGEGFDLELFQIEYPVKIVLLGNSKSGKSTFLDYFKNDTIENKNDSTHILRIEEFRESKTQILPNVIFYDFGGQDYYHGLYRAFLSSNSLNLIFWQKDSDYIGYEIDKNGNYFLNFNRPYWIAQTEFSFVQKRKTEPNEAEEPLVMVQTYADKESAKIESSCDLSNNVIREYFVSLKEGKENGSNFLNLQSLKTFITEQIQELRKTEEYAEWYIQFLKYILTHSNHNSVEVDKILKEYNPNGFLGQGKKEFLIDELDQLSKSGVILYYKNNPELNNLVWLSPSKIVKFIHDNILSKDIIREKKGILSRKDFHMLILLDIGWGVKHLLIQEKIVFHDEDEDRYIIPNYLPLASQEKGDNEYQLLKFGFSVPNFVLKFKAFIPFGFMNQLICAFGNQKDYKRFWRDQMIFTYKNCLIWIKLAFEKLELELHIRPKDDKVKIKPLEYELLNSIIALYYNYPIPEENEKIERVSTLKNNDFINYLKIIPQKRASKFEKDVNSEKSYEISLKEFYISKDNKNFINLFDLDIAEKGTHSLASYQRGDAEKFDKTVVKIIPVNALKHLTKNKNLHSMKKIFISYSKQDEDYKDEFVEHLYALKRQGLVSEFDDRAIKIGEEWHESIQTELKESDFVVALLSPSYVNTDYIQNHEIKIADELKKKIIPIFIRPVDWTDMIEAKFNAPLKAHPITLNKALYEKGEIKSSDRAERDAYWVEVIEKFRQDYFKNQT